MKWVLRVFRAMIALYLTAAIAVVIFSKLARGSRTDQIRRFNRDTLNPWMMQRAGGKHWYASVVKHTGRASGKEYETPVVMHEVDGHLAIPLPYGRDVDWLENLEHSGSSTINLLHFLVSGLSSSSVPGFGRATTRRERSCRAERARS